MENESLEEKQRAFDAWKAGQGKPAVVPVKPELVKEPNERSAYGVDFWLLAVLTMVLPLVGFLIGIIRMCGDAKSRKQGGSLIALSFAFGLLNFALMLKGVKIPMTRLLWWLTDFM